ncbi:MAG: DNA photolyase family protein [Hyphomonadaceae bacterium]|nr:DNA photolyase family protein [Hyphomonadaceae bacterium]
MTDTLPQHQPPAAPVLLWLRDDLRLDDNPALNAAAGSGPVVALFVFEDGIEGHRAPGGASRWWLHHSLASIASQLEEHGVPLLLRRGDPRLIVPDVAAQIGAARVHWNRRYWPWSKPVDAAVKQALAAHGVAATSHRGNVLVEPMEPKTGTGGPYKVYSPFFRAVRDTCNQRAALAVDAPHLTGAILPEGVAAGSLNSFGLLPTRPDWSGGLQAAWTPGEAGARDLATSFVAGVLKGYGEARNLPGIRSTSRLSPHLRHGEISVARLWAAASAAAIADPSLEADVEVFHKELVWREFALHLLHHWPDLADANWKADFDRFEWADDPAGLKAWQRGQTGYPIVDAGMRELWTTGWMHNRVRMIVASFLIKHLLIDWRHGEAWFWDTLVDADHASNAASWQWVAGCGADAAPYFRIFNPFGQGEKFDAQARYVRRWVPELARLPDNLIHQPWTAPKDLLSQAGVRLGDTYPKPIVDHARARNRALETYAALKAG